MRDWVVGAIVSLAALVGLVVKVLDDGEKLARTAKFVRRKATERWPRRAGEVEPTSLGIPSDQEAPEHLWGRDDLLRRLDPAKRRRPRMQVLAGAGGVGKSAVAAATAARAATYWWVPASTRAGLLEGLAVIVRDCGGSEQDVAAVRSGGADGPAHLARALHRHRRRWVVVLDNLDDVDVLGVYRRRLPIGRRGQVLITTRFRDQVEWEDADLINVDPLTVDQSADLLLGLAPGNGDRASARRLGERLGGSPLALRTAAKTLTAEFFVGGSFTDYLAALNEDPVAVLGDGPQPRDVRPREQVTLTYQLTLTMLALARYGRPDARPLLRALCLLAPATPIPDDALPADTRKPLRALIVHGLVERSVAGHVAVHPVIADVCRDTRAQSGAVAVVGRMLESAVVGSPSVRFLVLHVLELLRRPAGAVLIEHAARVVELLTDDRDTRTAAEVLDVAGTYRLDGADPATLALRHAACRVAFQLGRPVVDDLRAVRDDRAMVLGVDHLDTVESTRWFAWALAEHHQRYDEAGALLAGLVAAGPGVSKKRRAQALHVLCMLGWVRCCQKDHAEAERLYHLVIAGRTDLFDPEHPDTLDARHSLAKVLYEQGEFVRARDEFRDVLEIRRRKLGATHPDTLESLKYEALGMARTRRRTALRVLRRVREVQLETLGADHPNTADTVRLLHELNLFRSADNPPPATA